MGIREREKERERERERERKRERERERERELSLSHGVIIMPGFLLFYMESGLMITNNNVTVFIWEIRRWGGIDKRKI